MVNQETREFKQKREKRHGEFGVAEQKLPPGDEMVIEDTSHPPASLPPADQLEDQQQPQHQQETTVGSKSDSDPNPPAQLDSTNDDGAPAQASKAGGAHAKEADEAGDVMVVEGEDTVIY